MAKTKDLTQRMAEEKEWRARSNVKSVAYKPGDKPEEDTPVFDPFYGGSGENLIPFPRDRIKPWYEEDTRRRPEGIMGVASARGDREYLISVLTKYYTPRDLYYKNIKELEQMLQMHITESGGLI